ncbi:MAG: TRAP transporter small permease [Burkholderiaceae bacterium]
MLAILMLLTLGNVLVRYFTHQSFAWTEELSVFLMVVMTLAGSAVAVTHDAHLRIEYFYSGGGQRRRRMLSILSAVAMAVLFALLAVLSMRSAWSELEFGETTVGLGLPRWWYTATLVPMALAVSLRASMSVVRQLRAKCSDEVAGADE